MKMKTKSFSPSPSYSAPQASPSPTQDNQERSGPGHFLQHIKERYVLSSAAVPPRTLAGARVDPQTPPGNPRYKRLTFQSWIQLLVFYPCHPANRPV